MTVRTAIPVLLWVLALLGLGIVLAQLPLATLAHSVQNLSWAQWLAWLGVNLSIMAVATQRWRVISAAVGLPLRFGNLLMIRQAGLAVSFITPGPQFGGEPLQAYWLWKPNRPPLDRVLLGLGLDRFYELWINFAVLLLAVAVLAASSTTDIGSWQKIAVYLLLILLTLTAFGALILKQPTAVLRWLQRATQHWQHHPRLQHLQSQGQRLRSGLKTVLAEHKLALLQAFMLSLLGWVCLFAELRLVLGFVNLNLDVQAFLVIFVAMRMAFLLPLPGGIGSLEAAMVWAFQFLGLSATAALGVIALMRLRDLLTLSAGLVCVRVLQKRP
ncbi:MAG: flippase-like domain-containing protein [Methylococcaceae bacterium]|nr:flippase-like domain-containing protein [Methylococcaceae bacterium]